MTQETDCFKDFDFLDFAIDDKFLNGFCLPVQAPLRQAQYTSNSNYQAMRLPEEARSQQFYPRQRVYSFCAPQPQPQQQPVQCYYPNPRVNTEQPQYGTRKRSLATHNTYNWSNNAEEEVDYFNRGFDNLFAQDQQVVELERLKRSRETNSSCDTISIFSPASPRAQESVIKLETPLSKKRKLSLVTSQDSFKLKTKQKRTKWLCKEVESLWEGISQHGNNWRLIKKKSFGHRTYYQVKDKGRRILSRQGWSSGRTKATHNGASEDAKIIAEKILLAEEFSPRPAVDITAKVGSQAESVADRELDFDLEFPCK